MNKLVIFFLLTILITVSCEQAKKEKEEVEKTATTVMTLPARTKVKVDLINIRKAIQFYQAKHGNWPSSIKELKLDLYYPDDDWFLRHDWQKKPRKKDYRDQYISDGNHPLLCFDRCKEGRDLTDCRACP